MHEQTLSYYNSNADRFFASTHDVDMSSLYQPFLSQVPDGGHILDAGCGSGRDSLYFLQSGYEVTSLDASEAMVDLASRHIGKLVLHKSFEEMKFESCFDGVWACASLLHVMRPRMSDTLHKLTRSLKSRGTMYASFKYGQRDRVIHGRLFSDYDEATFNQLLQNHTELKIVKMWQTEDQRICRHEERWLNVLLRRR